MAYDINMNLTFIWFLFFVFSLTFWDLMEEHWEQFLRVGLYFGTIYWLSVIRFNDYYDVLNGLMVRITLSSSVCRPLTQLLNFRWIAAGYWIGDPLYSFKLWASRHFNVFNLRLRPHCTPLNVRISIITGQHFARIESNPAI